MKTVGPGRPRAGCAGACGSRAASGCPCGGCRRRRRRRCSPRPTRRRGCAGSTWSTVRPGLLGAAVLADPAVAGEHGLAGDPAPVDVARNADEADQADHLGAVEPHRLRAQHAVALLEHLGLLLQDQDQRAADGADVERLVAGVEDEHPPAGEPPDSPWPLTLGVHVRARLSVRRRCPALPRCDRGSCAHLARDSNRALTRSQRRDALACRSGSCRGSAPTRPSRAGPRSPRRPARRRRRPRRSTKNM